MKSIKTKMLVDREDALQKAEEFGIDLSILIENLRLTPTERLEKLRARLLFSEEIARAREKMKSGV
jgi:hypothetical protein